ncbi:hypothetical protein ACF0H5_015239 [Mactra antiquata]
MYYRQYSMITLLIYFMYIISRRVTATIQTDNLDQDNYQYIRDDDGRSIGGISEIRDTISSLDDDLAEYQKRTCRFGINSHHCALSAVDDIMNAKGWLNSFDSPGKRDSNSVRNPEITEKYTRILEDILRKRQHLAVLKQILQHAESKPNFKTKRSCHFNLGGVCATELASAVADQYYYLNGPNSPGKRRRRAVNIKH